MKIYVKTLRGKPIEIEINPSEKILKIKQFIEGLHEIPPSVQRLYFFGEILDDNNTIAHYDIQNESTIHLKYLFRENMKINVEINHKATGTIKFMKIGVKPRDVIGDIRNKIPDINTHSRLYYLGQELENNRNLSDYNIQDDSTITCDGISISNVGSGSDYDAQGDSTKTISNVESGSDYDVQGDSTKTISNVESGSMQIFIKTLSGKIFTLDVEPSFSILRVKKLIHLKTDLKTMPHLQRLIFANKRLYNDKTLEKYEIQNKSTLRLELKVRRGG